MNAKKNGLSEGLADAFAADAGFGFEEVTQSDLQIPFLRIIQALSPQLKKSDPAFIAGAGQGDIFNTVTNKVWPADEGVVVLPVFFQMKFLEFIPRSQGGGFVGELSAESKEVRSASRDKDSGMELLSSGNELVRTAQHYVKIVHEDGSLENAIVDMKNTYRLKSVEDGNDKGSWGSWNISINGPVASIENYNEAKELHGSISRGELKIAPPVEAEAITDQSSDEIPF